MADMPPRDATAAAVATWYATIAEHDGWTWCHRCGRAGCRERRRAMAELIACALPVTR